MIQSWMDTTIHDNFGICLSYDTETDGYIYKCTSRDYSGADSPSFNLYMSEDTTRWTNNISPTNDAFIATREQGAVSQRLLVADCGVLRSFLYFDISGIPEEATINRAVCTIHSDSLLGWPSYVNDFGLNLSLLEVPFDGSSDMAIYDDEILTANVNGDSANLLITNFVQAWSSQNKTNYGFLISGYTEDSDIYSQAFYSSEADSSLRPIMRVYYSLPPSSRLENQ